MGEASVVLQRVLVIWDVVGFRQELSDMPIANRRTVVHYGFSLASARLKPTFIERAQGLCERQRAKPGVSSGLLTNPLGRCRAADLYSLQELRSLRCLLARGEQNIWRAANARQNV